MKSLKRPLLSALVLWAGLAGPALAQERDQVERRLQSVGTLIESSSAARQIESSGDGLARGKRDNARLIHREAASTLQAGDTATASRLLDQAAREMMSGARLARPDQVAGAKDRRDFDARLESARALLAAQQRITQEKGNDAAATDAAKRVATLITAAEGQVNAGRLDEARPLVERAYLIARVSIESMRRGDTLVRSLKFNSPREEYDYEVDRNDTHRMLIRVVQADRPDAVAPMQAPIARAAALRSQAEAAAAQGDLPAAIKALEDATRELVRAIRAGGLYIPG
jgi:tetratricopeptide (TPR) repeat protein